MTNIGHKKKYTAPQTEILPADTNVCLLRGSWSVQSPKSSTEASPVEDGFHAKFDEGYTYGEVNTWNSD